jgi:FkbM family methyltransferase
VVPLKAEQRLWIGGARRVKLTRATAMKFLQQLNYHWPRVRNQLGGSLALGSRQYRVHGYHPNRLARDFDDEPHMIPVFTRILSGRQGTFLDVGANLGQTLVKVLAVDPTRAYVGFEPQLECCFYIEQFLRANSLADAAIVPVALSNRNRMVPLYWDQPHDTTASVLPSHAYSPDQRRPHLSWVAGRRGDEVVRELGIERTAAIKIDVEGFELEVLSGLSETIAQQRPAVVFEVLTNFFWNKLIDDDARAEKSRRASAIYALFQDAGYVVHRIGANGEAHHIEFFDLDTRADSKFANEGRDYVAIPRS